MYAQARKLLKMELRNKYGGGLMTPEAALEVSSLMSGGISNEELDKMDAAAIAARGNQTEAMANAQTTVNMGSPQISISVGQISGSYEARQLAEDVANHLRISLETAAGSTP